MKQEEILFNIEKLMPILYEFNTKGTANITVDEQQLLKATYEAMIPGVQVTLSCQTCLIHYLNMMLSYKERMQATLQSSTIKVEVVEEQKKEVVEVKPKITKRRK